MEAVEHAATALAHRRQPLAVTPNDGAHACVEQLRDAVGDELSERAIRQASGRTRRRDALQHPLEAGLVAQPGLCLRVGERCGDELGKALQQLEGVGRESAQRRHRTNRTPEFAGYEHGHHGGAADPGVLGVGRRSAADCPVVVDDDCRSVPSNPLK